MKKLLSLLLAFVMVMSIFTVPTFAVEKEVCTTSATNAIKTQTEAVAWLNSQGGASYNLDTSTEGTQCVEFVKAYVNWLLKGNAWTDAWGRGTGHGYQVWSNSLWRELGWEVYENTPDFMPMPGDIFSSGTSAYGHTGVVISSNLSTAVVADANVDKGADGEYHGSPVKIHTITWRSSTSNTAYGATHYIRPKFKNNTPHTHNYNTYVYYWASHPHYKCYKCSCGEVKENRNEPTYVASCTTCNHTHSYTTHSHYDSAHPHYQYLKCSCGATQVNTSKTSLKDGCDQCYPAMPVLNVRAGSDAEYVQFYWDATKNTDEYELKICDAVTGERVSYLTGVTTLNYQVKLPAGDYIVYPLSIKNSLRDTDRWWTSGASVSFTVTTGEFKSSAESIVDGKRYELFNIAMPWTEAKAKCEELGGHLVTITSQEEADVVNSLVAKGGRYCYWMGMTDEDGEWINVTGEPTSYSNWISGEPNNTYGVEHYAVVRNISGNNWNDVMNMYGSQYVGFICEYENNVEELDVTIKKDDSGINFIFEELDDVAYYEFFDAEDGAQVEYTTTIEDYHNYVWKPIVQGKSIFTIEVRAYDSNDQLIGVSETMKLKVDVTEVEEWRMYGDLDHDNRVSVLDATKIQMHIAAINKFDKFEMIQADVDSDKRVSIIDATTIQRYLASFVFDSDIGKGCYCSGTLYDYTIAPKVESGWVIASSVPADAEIVDEKWTYDLTTRTTSNSSTAPAGYSQYKDPTWEWGPYGPWSEWSRTVYSASDSRQVENKYYAATTKTVWKYSRDVSSDGKLSTYSLGYYGNKQYITLNYRLSSKGTVDGHTRYGSYDGGYGTYLQNYWWNESQATEVVTPAYYMYRYRDRSKVYTYYYHKVESKESETEILPSDTVSNVQKWVKYLEF